MRIVRVAKLVGHRKLQVPSESSRVNNLASRESTKDIRDNFIDGSIMGLVQFSTIIFLEDLSINQDNKFSSRLI